MDIKGNGGHSEWKEGLDETDINTVLIYKIFKIKQGIYIKIILKIF